MSSFDAPRPHLFAHRGGNQAGSDLENTMKAFDSAIKLGYKFIETDVIATADGRVITYHGAQNFIMKLIYGLEVRRALQRLTHNEIKSSLGRTDSDVPLLEDVLKKYQNVCFSIDVKTNQVVEPLIKLLQKQNAADRVIITSFSKRRTLKANKLLRGKKDPKACLCVYRSQGYLIKLFPKISLKILNRWGFKYIHIPFSCVDKHLIKVADSLNFKIYAWTVNDEKQIRRLQSIGVHGIISDETKLLMEISQR